MSIMYHTAKLSEIAELNPRLDEPLESNTLVSFVPMSAVTAESASTTTGEERQYSEVSKGYTPFRDGDVLVAKITPCFENGKIAQATIGHRIGFGSTEFHVVRPINGKSDARYLLHFLRQMRIRRDGERKMTGSAGQRRVPEHFLAKIEIPLPPLAEQRRIAEILDCAEALRSKRRTTLSQLDTLTQAIFFEMVGDPATNPKGWPVFKLGDLIADGPQNGLYKPASDYGSGTPILRIDAFYDGEVTKLTTLKRLRISDDEQNLYRLYPGNIVINRVNSMAYLGKSALIPDLMELTVFESNMMRFDVDRVRIDSRYLVQFLQTNFIKGLIQNAAKNAVNQSSINQQDVKGFQINVPPLSLQHKFSSRVSAVEKLKAAHRTSLTEMDALFASLQHRAFRGEL
ncbi:MAG: restriction endonuclease subunit S [Syntrophales bacterium]|nr:restriction endonuclease subunit S [Syntrophales bacterium]